MYNKSTSSKGYTMQSKFIRGLLTSEKENLSNFIALWEESTIINTLLGKGIDIYQKYINDNETNEFEKNIQSKKELLKNYSKEKLQVVLLLQLSSYLNFKLPKKLNYHSLDQLSLMIEKSTIELVRKEESEFTGSSLEELTQFIFKKMFDEMFQKLRSQTEEEKKQTIYNLYNAIQKMPLEQQEKLKSELQVDEITTEVLLKTLSAGTLSTALFAAINVAGFSAYTFATSSLASLAALAGISLPFSAFTGLTSLMAVLANPLTLLGLLGALAYYFNSKSDSAIKNKLLPIVIAFISLLSTDTKNLICQSESFITNYNKLILEFIEEHTSIEKLKNNLPSLKNIQFENNSVFALSTIPSSVMLSCNNSLSFLNEPIQNSSHFERLQELLDESYTSKSFQTNSAIATLTIGDFIYDLLRVDPTVIKAVNLARKDEILDAFNLAAFTQKIDIDNIGTISQIKGYVAEQLVAQQLQSQGYEVEFPKTSNQEGYDLLINGEPFQVKCGESPSLVEEHLEKYPDIPVLINEELAKYFPDNENVFVIEGIRNNQVTQLTQESLEHADEMLDYEFPIITLAVVTGKNILAVYQNKIDFENAIGKALEETSIRVLGGVLGSEILTIAGFLWMPAAGGILGSISFNEMYKQLQLKTFLQEEQKALNDAIISLLAKSTKIAKNNLNIAEKKYKETIRLLEEKQENDILEYFIYRYQQEYLYKEEKIELMQKIIYTENVLLLDEESSSILVAAQNALVLIQQVGIHPHTIQNETDQLLQAVADLNEALKTSQLTKQSKKGLKSFIKKLINFLQKLVKKL